MNDTSPSVNMLSELQLAYLFNRQTGALCDRLDIDSLLFKVCSNLTLFLGFAFGQTFCFAFGQTFS